MNPHLTSIQIRVNPRALDLLSTWGKTNAPGQPLDVIAVKALEAFFDGSTLNVVTPGCGHHHVLSESGEHATAAAN